MTETKWTPGPWAVDRPSDSNQRIYIVREFNWRLVASMENGKKLLAWAEEKSANANLIAAAPDLYAATDWDWLIELEKESLDDDQGGDNNFPIKLTVGQIRALMRARRKAMGK